MLACSAMVACTNDDVLENPKDPQNEANTAYVSVKLVMASDGSSRAADDKGYAVGSTEEQAISKDNSIFLFYDENGKWITSGTVEVPTLNTQNGAQDHNEMINDLAGDAYIVLSGPDQELKKSKQVLTVVNYHNCNSLKQLDKDEVLDIITNSTENTHGDGFLMTTSVYYDNGIVNTTAIDGETQICATQEEALGSPVKIYIERASAKVEANFSDTYEVVGDGENSTPDEDMVVDGNQVEAKIKINGWKLNAINENTNLVKVIDNAWGTTAPFAGWNWSDNHRSYWAMSTNWEMEYDGNNNGLTYFTYDETIGKSGSQNAEYCYEQTVAKQLTGVGDKKITYPNQTTILIAAEIQLKNDKGEFKTAGNLYKYGGVFYTEDNYKNLILKQLQGKYYTKTTTVEDDKETTTTADLTNTDITLEIETDGSTLAGVQYKVTLNDVTVYTKEGETDKSVDATAIATYINDLGYVKEVEGYQAGKCYYHIPIEHLSSVDGEPFYGVVRNHWYKLNISAVKHIGSAIYNPGMDIVEIPAEETTFYLAAALHVLSWHVVEQNVELN